MDLANVSVLPKEVFMVMLIVGLVGSYVMYHVITTLEDAVSWFTKGETRTKLPDGRVLVLKRKTK